MKRREKKAKTDSTDARYRYCTPLLMSSVSFHIFYNLSHTNNLIKSNTVDIIIAKAEVTAYKMAHEIKQSAQLLVWAMENVGKEGPIWFDCGVIAHNDFINDELYDVLKKSGTSDTFQIGKEGEIIELDDILCTLRAVSKHKVIKEWRYDWNRSYYHEGYKVSKDGKTIKMIWGS